MQLRIAHTADELRQLTATFRANGETLALVPTMGALHAGHISLVALARTLASRVAVSIFVNPTQFGPNEDFSRYPRTLEADMQLLREAGADMLYAPDVADMYPQGFATTVSVHGVSEGLCGAARPGHFDGVATVVAKLLLRTLPDVAIFGEKDYQQLAVIRRMAQDLDIPARIVGAPILREADGLAMSSRNAYLSAPERKLAPALHAELLALAENMRRKPVQVAALCAASTQELLAKGFDKVDYMELRHAHTLALLEAFAAPARLLAAAWVGKTRLIDNIEVI